MRWTICAWSFLSGKILNYEFNICSRCRTISISFFAVKLFSSRNVLISFLFSNWQKILGGLRFPKTMVSSGICILFNFLNSMVIFKSLRATFKLCILYGSVCIYYLTSWLLITVFFFPCLDDTIIIIIVHYLLCACHFKEYAGEDVDYVIFT